MNERDLEANTCSLRSSTYSPEVFGRLLIVSIIICSHTRLYAFGQQRAESLQECQAPFFWVSLDNLLSGEKYYFLETQNEDIWPMELQISEPFPLI